MTEVPHRPNSESGSDVNQSQDSKGENLDCPMTEASHQSDSEGYSRSSQSHDVQVGGDFNVMGKGNQVDFSQIHIETQIIQQQASVSEVQSLPLITTSPYKGLKKFEATDRQRFFGRESLVVDLVTHLTTARCVILLGASGSGKSSLVRAGIIPKLEEKHGTHLIDLTFTPDEDPFESLYASLRSHFKYAEAKLARQVDPNTLTQIVQQLQAPDIPWVIFVDQFEELFSITPPPKREAFIASLINLQQMMAQEQEGDATEVGSRSLYLILAMRADFLDQFGPYRELGQLTERYIRFITNMTRDDLKRAIVNPANLHGVAYQEGLLQEILNDLQDQPGELSLLQYTLDLLWKQAKLKDRLIEDRLICCDTYWEIDGVQGALRQHVNKIYDHLSSADQTRARQIFLSLVDTSANRDNPEGPRKAVSRRAYISQFTDPETRRVLIHLIDANLLVSNWRQTGDNAQTDADDLVQTENEILDDETSSHRATVELAHETLIRSWPQLQTWLEENQEIINLKHRLSDQARNWYDLTQKFPDQAVYELWLGSKLAQVEELRRNGVLESLFGSLEVVETEFIDAGLAERDRQQHEEEKRRQQELLLYRTIAVGAVLFSGVILLLGTAATLNWRAAQQQEIEALITAADASFTENRYSLDTLVAAIEAGDRLQKSFWVRGDSELQAKTIQVVSQAVYWVREQGVLSGHGQFVESVSITPNEGPEDQLIATAGRDGTVRIWRPNGKKPQIVMEQQRPFSYVEFSPDGSTLAIADYDGKVAIWSQEYALPRPLGNDQDSHQKVVREVGFHPKEPRLATASDDGAVIIWDYVNGHRLNTLNEHQAAVNAVTYSLDGKFLVTGGDDQTVILWDSGGNQLQTIDSFAGSISHLSFSKSGQWLVDGDWLAIAMDNGTVEIRQFDPNGATLLSPDIVLSGHADEITEVQFSPNGTLIATASVDGTAKIWNRFGKELYTLEGHAGRINGLDFNTTGTLLTTASNDGTVKLWNLNPPSQRILSGHFDDIYSIDFSSDDELLATAGTDDKILLWDVTTPHVPPPKVLLAGADINNIDIHPEKHFVAGAIEDGTVKLWNIDGDDSSEIIPLTIPAHGEKQASDVQFSPNGLTLISVGYDSAIRFWQLPDGELQDTLQLLDQDLGGIYTLSLTQDANLLATSNDNNTVSIWQLDTRQSTTIDAHEQPVYQALFTPNGQNLITASEDKAIKLWSFDGTFQQKLTGHKAGIWGLDISLDNQLIASGSDDGTAIIWTIEGDRLLQIIGHQEAINTVSFSHNRHWLATGSADDIVILWNTKNLSLQSFLDQGCDWLNQNQYELSIDLNNNLNNKIQHLCPS